MPSVASQPQREAHAGARLGELTSQLQSLAQLKSEADAARADAEAVLQQERLRYEGSQAAAELRKVVAVVQSQLGVKEQQLKHAQVRRRLGSGWGAGGGAVAQASWRTILPRVCGEKRGGSVRTLVHWQCACAVSSAHGPLQINEHGSMCACASHVRAAVGAGARGAGGAGHARGGGGAGAGGGGAGRVRALQAAVRRPRRRHAGTRHEGLGLCARVAAQPCTCHSLAAAPRLGAGPTRAQPIANRRLVDALAVSAALQEARKKEEALQERVCDLQVRPSPQG